VASEFQMASGLVAGEKCKVVREMMPCRGSVLRRVGCVKWMRWVPGGGSGSGGEGGRVLGLTGAGGYLC